MAETRKPDCATLAITPTTGTAIRSGPRMVKKAIPAFIARSSRAVSVRSARLTSISRSESIIRIWPQEAPPNAYRVMTLPRMPAAEATSALFDTRPSSRRC